MAALGNRPQPDGHFLNDIGNGSQQYQEPDQAITILGSGGGIGCDAAGIVIRHHHQNAGSGDQGQEMQEFHNPSVGIKEF